MTQVPDITEAEFQGQVVELATMLGWSWAHFRPAKTSRGWRVPVSGPLGAGWPDLVLVRDERLIFAELKRSTSNRPSPDQVMVLTLLAGAAETYVWTPADFEDIATVLSRPRSGM
jgi:hypothetical protein